MEPEVESPTEIQATVEVSEPIFYDMQRVRVEPMMLQELPKAKPKNAGPYGHREQLRAYNGSEWYSCRDQFHANVGTGAKINCKGFYYGAEDPHSLMAILDWTERALNIRPEYRCRIFICQEDVKKPRIHPLKNKDNLIFIEMTDFWREEKIRFYFLTALCRSAVSVATWKHPLDTILQVTYFNQTPVATGQFLNGYTILNGPNKKLDSNWCNVLYGDQHRNLARPTANKELAYFYDEDCRPSMSPAEKWQITKWVRGIVGDKYGDDGKPPFGF
jgi:hypothetical protein